MKKDITGQRFGRLVAICPTGKRGKWGIEWECVCDCGNVALVTTNGLTRGHTKSCGCIKRDRGRMMVTEMTRKLNAEIRVEGTDLKRISGLTQANNISGKTGVYWSSREQKWVASISFRGKRYTIGRFNDFDKAVRAREEAEEKYFTPILEKYGRKSSGENDAQ